MKGKVLFVAGLATGYVLGSRAGRERYEQIKAGWLKLYNSAPVQSQVAKAKGFATARVSAVPQALIGGVNSVVGIVRSDKTVGQKLDATIAEVGEVKEQLDEVAEGGNATTSTTRKPAAKKSAAKKPAAKRSGGSSSSSS